ncbi:MAG: 54S ribosomal protein L9, mitochondrial [Piccolia ochrophora]|nr:MAG: 54S ribosomal protein L9, mitochondrial [Piccolia ochrophora]
MVPALVDAVKAAGLILVMIASEGRGDLSAQDGIDGVLQGNGVLTFKETRGIKSIHPPRPDRFNKGPGLPTLTASTAASLERKAYTLPPRAGLLAIKKGMTALYAPDGKRTACTVLQVDRVQVVSHKTRQKNGYFAVQVGSGSKKSKNVTRPMLGHFAIQGVSPKRFMSEFRVKDESGLAEVGKVLGAGWFVEGQFVDARANCKGKGFAGGMKRHGFKGQPASHGVSLTHRSMGSAGQSQGGGSRVYPGKKMAGRMGGQQVTVQNARVMQVDDEKGIIVLNGSISGPNGCIVKLQDALKKPWPDMPSISPPSGQSAAEPLRETI